MSLLIKNMEMPKDRPVCIVIDAAGQARRYDLNNDRYADDKLFEAVTVPPHGDLVDRDAIRKDWLENYRYALTRSILDSLDSADTIIPAEKAESENN